MNLRLCFGKFAEWVSIYAARKRARAIECFVIVRSSHNGSRCCYRSNGQQAFEVGSKRIALTQEGL